MAYTTLENVSDLGLQGILAFPSQNVPLFYPLFLFVVFFVITALSLFREIDRDGKGNILSSLAVGGICYLRCYCNIGRNEFNPNKGISYSSCSIINIPSPISVNI